MASQVALLHTPEEELHHKWAKTLNVPSIGEVEKGIEELVEKTGGLRN